MTQATRAANDVIHFKNDDDGFRRWVEGNPNGYVVNSYRSPTGGYLKLHRASCSHLKLDTVSNLTADYMKSCSTALRALKSWAKEQLDAELQPCHFCDPR